MKISEKLLTGSALLCLSLILSACGGQSEEPSSAEGPVEIPEAPDAAVQTIAHELADGNTGILWQAMPASYQSDLNEIAQLAGTKIDPEIYNQTFGLFGRLGAVVNEQKAFVVNNQFFAQQPEEEKAKMEAAIPAIAKLLNTITSSPIASAEGLQNFSGHEFFETTVSKLTDDIAELAKLSGEEGFTMDSLREMTVSVVESGEGTATLQMEVPGEEPETEVFTQVEGRWVPQEMAAEWSASMADAKAQLNAITPEQIEAQKPQILGVLTMFDGVLNQLESAETQAEFDQALQGAMMPIMGLMMMGQGGGMGPSMGPQTPQMPQQMPSEPVE